MIKGNYRRRPRRKIFYPWYLITHPAKLALVAFALLFLYYAAPALDFTLTKILCAIGSHRAYCRTPNVP